MRSATFCLSLLFNAIAVSANLDCSPDSFSSLLPSNTTVTFATPATHTGKFSQNDVNISIPGNVTKAAFPICVIELNVQSSPNTSFNTGVLLPNNWNGRLFATGNPGFGGGIRWSFQANVLQYGPAVTVSTDTGHVGAANNISWAINNPDSIIDWSYRSLHESTVLAKQLAKAFYGGDVQHSYYTACSNGGRQGLKEVQMYPDDYDGVLAGAPPWQITHLHPWALQIGLWNLPSTSSSHILTTQFGNISDMIVAQCDAQDGLTDGIIQEPYSCNFSSELIMCNSSSTKSNSCLHPAQIETLSLFYNDWQTDDGTLIYPRFPLSASASRYGSVTTAPDHFGLEFFYGFVYNTTSWNWTDFQGAQTVDLVSSLNPGDAAALDMDLSDFKGRGGKLIMYHGLSDTTIPTGSSIEYYQGVNTTMGGEVDDFFRLFLVPGMGHCGQSEVAPYYIAAAGQVVQTAHGNGFSVPGYVDAQHDVLLAMMNWVENGTTPDQVIATKWQNDTYEDGISMQRPLCPYPSKSVYSGSGDWKLPDNWSCQNGELLALPAANGTLGTVKTVGNATTASSSATSATSTSSHKNAASAVTTLNKQALICAGIVSLAFLAIEIVS